jgi:hypothetical protein
METKGIICYDLVLRPQDIEITTIFDIARKTNFLFYDSYEFSKYGYNAKPPYLLDGTEMDKLLVDISTKEGKKIYKEVIKNLTDGK